MMYLKYLWNKYYTFGRTVYQVIKVLYKAKSKVMGFSVNIITEDCLKDFDVKVKEREAHLDELRAQAADEMVIVPKSELN